MRKVQIWCGPVGVKEIADKLRSCPLTYTPSVAHPFISDILEGTEHVLLTAHSDDRVDISVALRKVLPFLDSVVFPGGNTRIEP